MKVGDLVNIVGSHAKIVGTIIEPWKADGWWTVLTQRGELINWPESQMKSLNQSAESL